MKIDLTQPVLDYEGKRVPLDEESDFLLRNAFYQALNSLTPEEAQAGQDPETKAHIFAIASRIANNDEVDLGVDDVPFIKERAGRICPALVYGRLSELFDEKSKQL